MNCLHCITSRKVFSLISRSVLQRQTVACSAAGAKAPATKLLTLVSLFAACGSAIGPATDTAPDAARPSPLADAAPTDASPASLPDPWPNAGLLPALGGTSLFAPAVVNHRLKLQLRATIAGTFTAPAICATQLYTAALIDGTPTLFAYGLDGTEQWRRIIPVVPNALACDATGVYLGEVTALAKFTNDGQLGWRHNIPNTSLRVTASARGATLMVTSDNTATHVSQDGATLWSTPVARPTSLTVPLRGLRSEALVLEKATGQLRALALADGAARTLWTSRETVIDAAVIADETGLWLSLVQGSADGQSHARILRWENGEIKGSYDGGTGYQFIRAAHLLPNGVCVGFDHASSRQWRQTFCVDANVRLTDSLDEMLIGPRDGNGQIWRGGDGVEVVSISNSMVNALATSASEPSLAGGMVFPVSAASAVALAGGRLYTVTIE